MPACSLHRPSMASRRLDISSLLCDDPQPPAFSPLEALVHAATEERRRLDEPHPAFHPPYPHRSPPERPFIDGQHIARSPVLARQPYPDQLTSPHLHRQHPVPVLPHQDLHQQRIQQHRAQELEHRAYEADRRRRAEDADHLRRLEEQREFQRQQELERLRIQEERRLREEERQRALEQFELQQRREAERVQAERQHQQQQQLQQLQQQQREYQRLREEQQHQREREELRREAERQRLLELQREEQRQVERAKELERQRELDRQRELLERQQRELLDRQQREATERQQQREFERQQELRRRQQLLQQGSLSLRPNDPHGSPSINPSSHPVSISQLISHPPHPSPDLLQIKHSTSPISPDPPPISVPPPPHDDSRPIKKRRYSESPTRPIPDDKEHIAREREKMLVGELGYGRVDSPVVAGPSSAPRRPGSGHGQGRKAVAVSDLLMDKERAPVLARPDSRGRDAHHVVSPLGRRSPPGSQIGRAKAARKSDEHLSREPPLPPPPTKESIHPVVELDVKKPKVKQELKPPRSRTTSDDTQPPAEEPRPPKKPVKEPAPPPPRDQPPPAKVQPDDAHEWFLHQYDEEPSPTTSSRPEPPHTPSPSVSPVAPAALVHIVKSPVTTHKTLTPITAAVALEQELEDLVSDALPTAVPNSISATSHVMVKKQEPDDMDLDLAVEELVGTLENNDEKLVGMEVDVEDELLSLVDDRPPPSSSTVRRPSGPAAGSHGSGLGSGSVPHGVASANMKQPPLPPLRSVGDGSHSSSPTMSASLGATLISTSAVRQSSARPTPDRGSMPPPTTTVGALKKGAERAGSVVPPASGTKKKKETAAKASKAKAASTTPASTSATSAPPAANSTAAKSKAKPAAKSKKGNATDTTSVASAATPPPRATKAPGGRKNAHSTSRSRSTSVMPGGSASVGPESEPVKAEKQEEEEDSDAANDDDKLYCVCKTKYDEDRFMIACDRCDDWYHTQCVNMPDLEVDLVDQFICPPCIDKNSHLNLQTTYKQRCLYGLRHPDPSSPKACHKAARGAFSKYCSDECGIKYMQSRIDSWAKKGGKTEKLWESVKHAEKREGVVVCAADPETNGCTKMEVDVKQEADVKPAKHQIVPPSKSKAERERERLNGLLESVVRLREEVKRGMEVIVWRERLLQLATERAVHVGQCGWDQRLCFDDDEWADIGAAVFESYEETKNERAKEGNGDGDMEVDGTEEQWWCPGQKVCERHAGWQMVRHKDVCKEKEKKEEALAKLTTREREIRKRIEDMLDPQSKSTSTSTTTTKEATSNAPLKSANTKVVNGHTKSKSTTVAAEKKGKKRKAPSA